MYYNGRYCSSWKLSEGAIVLTLIGKYFIAICVIWDGLLSLCIGEDVASSQWELTRDLDVTFILNGCFLEN